MLTINLSILAATNHSFVWKTRQPIRFRKDFGIRIVYGF